MRILFDSTRPIKAPSRFARGLTWPPSGPSHEDRLWWDRECARLEDERLEDRARESAALDSVTRGLIPHETAVVLMASSVIGHDDGGAMP